MCDRRAEDRQQAVPSEIVDGAAVGFDDADGSGDGLADHQLDFLGAQAFGQRRRSDDIGKQGGNNTALFSDGRHQLNDSSTGHPASSAQRVKRCY